MTVALGLLGLAACSGSTNSAGTVPGPRTALSITPPMPDPRVGLKPGMHDAGEAYWNMRMVSNTKPSAKFVGSTNSDLAFAGNLVFQGNYNGYQVWDISNAAKPTLAYSKYCPASQSDVSVYKNLLFVSAEGNTGRIDCGDQGVKDPVSKERIRGLRIFDITDVANPRNMANVQTCRGSHTHSVLVDPKDSENIYVYISGSAPSRSELELPGCVRDRKDPNTAEFRIEVIKVPLKDPSKAAVVSTPRIFNDLAPVKSHGAAPDDLAAVQAAKARGEFIVNFGGGEQVMPAGFSRMLLDSVVRERKGTGPPTSADSAALRAGLPGLIAKMIGREEDDGHSHPGVTSCHDITIFPAIGMAGGACEGYGLLIDIRDPANPRRTAAVSDTNFSYWHSATFNDDGTKILFSDEWGGGGGPKCRATDPKEWGANAIFTIENGRMVFQSYYKISAAQTSLENCVAHNGSIIPIPGRDVMVQAFYQGGLTVFDWTDPKNPKEIAYFDRGPIDGARMGNGGSWSVYWYNGYMISSEIGRGLDILELTPSPALTQNEIDAAKTVKFEYLNAQGQPKHVWPPSFALARAYVDQLERSGGLKGDRVAAIRQSLSAAEQASGSGRSAALSQLAGQVASDANGSNDAAKVRKLADAVRSLAAAR
ncbi:MAG: LVIVD repeat-containing protein [Gemmatimonadales bacterium]